MNTNELRCMLTKDPMTRQNLRDVFAIDHFKDFVAENSLLNGIYVVNTEESYKSGSHWLLVYVTDDKVVFVDTFSRSPDYFNLSKELFSSKKPVKTLKKQIQSFTSDICGGYVVYFSVRFCRGDNLDKIVKDFCANDLSKNDFLIANFIYNYFPGHYKF